MSPQSWAARINRAAGRSGRVPAVVMGAGPNGLANVRSLGRHGVPVFVLDSKPWELAMHSRFAEPLVLPDPVAHAAEWLDFLREAGASLDCRPVVIAAGDAYLRLLAEECAEMDSRYALTAPPATMIQALLDKRRQYRMLLDCGATLPETRFPETEAEALEAGDAVGFPCLVKPAYSHLWVRSSAAKLVVAGSREQLKAVYRSMNAAGPGLVVQELIPGADDALYGFAAYLDAEGQPLAWGTKRKLRQYPPGFGNGSYQISANDPEVAEESIRIFQRLTYRGFGAIEYKRDTRDGRLKLIEINLRTVSGLQNSIDAGVDLPWVAYCHLTGVELPATESRAGVRFVNLSWEAQRFWTSGRRSPVELARWLYSLLQARSFAVLSLRDPGPALSLIRRALGRIAGPGEAHRS